MFWMRMMKFMVDLIMTLNRISTGILIVFIGLEVSKTNIL